MSFPPTEIAFCPFASAFACLTTNSTRPSTSATERDTRLSTVSKPRRRKRSVKRERLCLGSSESRKSGRSVEGS